MAELQLTFTYNGSDKSDTFAFDIADSLPPATIKSAIWDINDSLAGGTADSLDSFFVDDDGNHFNAISAAKIIKKSETIIYP